MPAHQAAGDLEILLARLLAGLEHSANARRIDGERLLHEDVAALGDGVLQVNRPEGGRRRQDHDPAGRHQVDGLPIGVESDELPLRGNVHLLGQLLAKRSQAAAEAVRKGVGHSDEFCRSLGAQRLGGRAAAPSPATHQGNPDGVVFRGISPVGNGRGQRGPRQDARLPEKLAARGLSV